MYYEDTFKHSQIHAIKVIIVSRITMTLIL